MSILADSKLEAFLDALHAQSNGQSCAIEAYFRRRIAEGSLSWEGFDAQTNAFFSDKMVALDRIKAEFCFAQCRAIGAKRIVECGTSYGVSTLYLAAAVRDNGGGTVIATEWEPRKAKFARKNFETAGLARYIDLREGDLAETLARIDGSVDFVLFDIWTEAVMPAMRRIWPHLSRGAVLVADNTRSFGPGYAAYFAFIAEPKNRLITMTLPFDGGLEMTIKV